MFQLEAAAQTGVAGRKDRWPDPGVWHFVDDLMKEAFGIDIRTYPEHVVPIAIVATLDWVTVNGVWVFRNTGLFQTDEPYRFVFEYEHAELAPNDVCVFRDEQARNQFAKRLAEPGLSQAEREEALGYVREVGFIMWEKGRARAEAEQFTPPDFVTERVLWCTLMWVLSQNGRDWLYGLDPIISSTHDFGVGYLYTPESVLLDPKRVIMHPRQPHSCRLCNNSLWCVAGACLKVPDDKGLRTVNWYHVCVNCLVALWRQDPDGTDDFRDDRILRPPCPHIEGIEVAHRGTCRDTCPHSGVTQEKVWEAFEKIGRGRAEKRIAEVQRLGQNPDQAAGVQLEQLVDYFNQPRGN